MHNTNNLKTWIKEAKKDHHDKPDILKILEELEDEVSIGSVIKGTILTEKLCEVEK
jgi:hypothetical protein